VICPIQRFFYSIATARFDASVWFAFSSDKEQSNRVVFSVRFASPSVRFLQHTGGALSLAISDRFETYGCIHFSSLCCSLFCFADWRWPIASRTSYYQNDGCLQMPSANTFSSSSYVLICVMLTDAVSLTDLFSKLSFKLSSFGKYMPMSPSYFPYLAYLCPHGLPYLYDKG
jgi:hypothetical protein